MGRVLAILVLSGALAGCDLVTALIDGSKHASAVETDLQKETGMKPSVGFNWHNGELRSVTVTFPRLYEEKPLDDLAATVRAAVRREFGQAPEIIVLGFSMPGTAPGRAAQVETKRPTGDSNGVNFGLRLAAGPH